MKKKLMLFATLGMISLLMVSCCDKKQRKVEYQARLQCSEDLLHYVTPVVEYSDYTGEMLVDTLTEADFSPIEYYYVTSNGDTASFFQCDLVNKVFVEYGVYMQAIVRYVPKEVEYSGGFVCFGHGLSDSVVVSQGKYVRCSIGSSSGPIISISNNIPDEVERLMGHPDTLTCLVDEDGNVKKSM